MQRENGKEDILAEYETIPRVQMTQEELQRLAHFRWECPPQLPLTLALP